jgi:hypothetical protein
MGSVMWGSAVGNSQKEAHAICRAANALLPPKREFPALVGAELDRATARTTP